MSHIIFCANPQKSGRHVFRTRHSNGAIGWLTQRNLPIKQWHTFIEASYDHLKKKKKKVTNAESDSKHRAFHHAVNTVPHSGQNDDRGGA